MSSIREGQQVLQQGVASGTLKLVPPAPPIPIPVPDLEPAKNSLMRTPMPAGGIRDPDITRQFHQTAIPQIRILQPAASASPHLVAAAQSTASQQITSQIPPSAISGGQLAAQALVSTPGGIPGGDVPGPRVQLKDSSVLTPLDTQNTPATGMGLTQSGTTTTINMASGTMQFGFGNVAYNSASVNPGSFGTFYVYLDDPFYNGGARPIFATTSTPTVVAATARLYVGRITTVSTGGASGGGGGGIPGGGGRFTN